MRAGGVLLALAASAGCAAKLDAGSRTEVAAALARGGSMAAPLAPEGGGRQMAYLVLGGAAGARLAAFDLQTSRQVWMQHGNVSGRIVVGRGLLVHADRAVLVARDLGSGAERWRFPVPDGETLVGYAAESDRVYLVTRRGNELRGGEAELIALTGVEGRVRWRQDLGTARVAAPAARGDLVAVPNRSQLVTLFDAGTGRPLADVLSREQTADFVTALPEGLFYGFGTGGAFLLTAETATGLRSSPGFLRAKLPQAVREVYHFDSYKPELFDYTAIDRNRLIWRPRVEGNRASFVLGTVIMVHFRFFGGFDSQNGALRWAYSHSGAEAVSAAHTGRAIVFATADGELGALDARTGRRLYQARVPGEVGTVKGATFDAEGFAPEGGPAGETPGLAAALGSIVRDPDRRFPEMKVFALEAMATVPGRAVTADLLAIARQRRERPRDPNDKNALPPIVYQKAAAALVARKDASAVDLFVEALRSHADHADGVRPPDVELLARALGAIGPAAAKQAAAPLAEHLGLPETEPGAVTEIARALAALGGEEAVPALRDYLVMYRADPLYQGDPVPLYAVSDALVKLGGPMDRELLLYVAEEPRTLDALRGYVRRALGSRAQATAP
jgi:outer membrane protein assembly factor BamB